MFPKSVLDETSYPFTSYQVGPGLDCCEVIAENRDAGEDATIEPSSGFSTHDAVEIKAGDNTCDPNKAENRQSWMPSSSDLAHVAMMRSRFIIIQMALQTGPRGLVVKHQP